MKNFFILLFSLSFLQHMLYASKEKSICEQIQDFHVAFCISIVRCVKTDNEILRDVAGSKDNHALEYCLNHKIGDVFDKDAEGRTALDTALIRGNPESINMIIRKYNYDSDSDCDQNSPTSVAQRKKFTSKSLKTE